MRSIFAIALAASIVSAAPALAQSAGYYGAPSGHNTPGSGVGLGIPNSGYNGDNYNNGWNNSYNNGWFGDERTEGAGYGFGYDNPPGRDSYGVPNPSGAIEGRAAADDADIAPNRMRRPHRRMEQDRRMMDPEDQGMNR